MYSTPTRPQPICPASRMRCDSPPESVGAVRSSVRYSSPTFCRKPSRPRISLSTSAAISFSLPSSSSSAKNSAASETASAHTSGSVACGRSANFGLAVVTVTARACGLSRWPAQSGQRITLMYCSSCRICGGLLLVRYFSSSSGMMPSNVPPYFCAALPARQVNVMCSSPVPHSQMSRSFCGKIAPRRFQQRALGQRELALHRLGHAAIDVPLPAAQILPRADQLDAALGERLLRRRRRAAPDRS